jgi:hypothetical protein
VGSEAAKAEQQLIIGLLNTAIGWPSASPAVD